MSNYENVGFKQLGPQSALKVVGQDIECFKMLQNSADAAGVTNYAGPELTTATITPNSLKLDDLTGKCSLILYQY